MVQAQGEMGSVVRLWVGVEGSRDGDFIEALELTEEVRVELQLEQLHQRVRWIGR